MANEYARIIFVDAAGNNLFGGGQMAGNDYERVMLVNSAGLVLNADGSASMSTLPFRRVLALDANGNVVEAMPSGGSTGPTNVELREDGTPGLREAA